MHSKLGLQRFTDLALVDQDDITVLCAERDGDRESSLLTTYWSESTLSS